MFGGQTSPSGPITGPCRRRLLMVYAFAGAAPRRVQPRRSADRLCSPWALIAGLSPGLSRLAAGMAYYSCSQPCMELSGPGGVRTLGLHNAIVARSQLRYGPIQMELRGLEPLTSTVRLWRSPN